MRSLGLVKPNPWLQELAGPPDNQLSVFLRVLERTLSLQLPIRPWGCVPWKWLNQDVCIPRRSHLRPWALQGVRGGLTTNRWLTQLSSSPARCAACFRLHPTTPTDLHRSTPSQPGTSHKSEALLTIATQTNIWFPPRYVVAFAFVLLLIGTDDISHSCSHRYFTPSVYFRIRFRTSECNQFRRWYDFASCNFYDNGNGSRLQCDICMYMYI